MKTKCYYSDYVNHMIRFFLSTPEKLDDLSEKRKADLDNWIAVQAIWYKLSNKDREVLTNVYGAHHWLAEGVRIYCENTGADSHNVWVLITKTSAAIARKRGLI